MKVPPITPHLTIDFTVLKRESILRESDGYLLVWRFFGYCGIGGKQGRHKGRLNTLKYFIQNYFLEVNV